MNRPCYSEIQERIGSLPYPTKSTKYRAYKDGECKVFESRSEAIKYSTLIESFCDNIEEYQYALSEYNKREQEIFDTWYSEIREHFSSYSEAEIDVMYDYAYDRGHAYGYDEVFSYMVDFSYYIDKLKACYLNNLVRDINGN